MITYAYERVSSKDQNLERQETAIRNYRPNISDANIFKDKVTGKTFDREHYNEMKIILEHLSKVNATNDLIEVVFEEMDRLGRDKESIKKELQWYKDRGIYIRILELPSTLVDIDSNNKWVMDMVTNILIEVYATMAQQELEKRAKRQTEGIIEAQKKGIKFGRQPIQLNESEFMTVYNSWKAAEINARQAMNILGIKPNTFYRRVKEYEATQNIQPKATKTNEAAI
ncbi:MAG TPA: resolvase [Lachnospiraceae bacterium]|nr:resolvase [Lachnospiraceae bacterium]